MGSILNLKNKSVLATKRQPEKSELLASFTNGIIADAELYQQEIKVQKAWALCLAKINILTHQEAQEITKALELAHECISKDNFEWKIADEDIHMNLERFVNENTDDLGKKMHAGRSRNDLIATTLKLHVFDSANEIISLVKLLIETISNLAKKHIDIIIPGMTHLQNGQPIRWSHALLAHAWAFKRDLNRLNNVRSNAIEIMPLGSAALSGTTLPVDLTLLAQMLGFKSTPLNSYDQVGDRDSLIEMLQAISLLGAHLSRFAEDLIYWASSAVGLIKLSPNWSTGSSIMPNKRNPDVAELIRAKASLWMGDASGALTLLKGLGTCYGSDLHETKIPYLRVIKDCKLALQVFSHFIAEIEPDIVRAQELLGQGHILATEIADELNKEGIAFREAYQIVASMVELAESKKTQVHQLNNDDLKKSSLKINPEIMKNVTYEQSVEKRKFSGGTSKAQILDQISRLSNC